MIYKGILGKKQQLNAYEYYFKALLNKLNLLFKFHNLPETINESFLNSNLFLFGYSAFFKMNDKLYTNFGGIGGKPNSEYYSTTFTLSNPVLGSKMFNINSGENDNCVLVYNSMSDEQFIHYYGSGGLYQLIHQTATLLADNVQSINMAQINSRVQTIFTADNTKQANTAEQVIKRMYAGEPYQILLSDDMTPFQAINIQPNADGTIEKLLEIHQYILADFYNQIGIPTTPYQKKERMITDEINTLDLLNECNLSVMLESRERGIEKVNKLFGTDIEVELNPIFTNANSENIDNTNNTDEEAEVKENDNQNILEL